MIDLKALSLSLAISLGIGAASCVIIINSMEAYKELVLPPLAPSGYVFLLIWIATFILMGISSYIIYVSKSDEKNRALIIYGTQLLVNFFWPIIFFSGQMFLLAYFWLLILWVLVVSMITYFYPIDKLSGLLQVPYLIWVTFAGYLNFMIYYLNI